jgi:hypothetical protein
MANINQSAKVLLFGNVGESLLLKLKILAAISESRNGRDEHGGANALAGIQIIQQKGLRYCVDSNLLSLTCRTYYK